MHVHDLEHGVTVGSVPLKGSFGCRQLGGGGVGVAGHHGGDQCGECAAVIAVIRVAQAHDECAEVGIAEPKRPVRVGVVCDAVAGVAGVVDQDFLGDDEHAHDVFELIEIKIPFVIGELHQVDRCQVAGAVVEEHVFGTGVACIDATAFLTGVPAVDRGIILDTRVSAKVRGF